MRHKLSLFRRTQQKQPKPKCVVFFFVFVLDSSVLQIEHPTVVVLFSSTRAEIKGLQKFLERKTLQFPRYLAAYLLWLISDGIYGFIFFVTLCRFGRFMSRQELFKAFSYYILFCRRWRLPFDVEFYCLWLFKKLNVFHFPNMLVNRLYTVLYLVFKGK